jgi:isopentenyl phosphate kinase
MSERIMLKIGGSVITDKSSNCAINRDSLGSIAAAVAGRKSEELVIIHGAGSCGHPEAKQYRIDHGVGLGNTKGIAITHQVVSQLNGEVVAALRLQGIEAVGIHPLHAAFADNGRIVAFESLHLKKMLALGMVPVLHGDVVMDRSRGACIVSGDQLVRHLAPVLGIDRVGLATDVPGVLDGGVVVPVITPASASTLQIGHSTYTDVTGGMRGKINELLDLARAGVGSEIFHVSRIPDFLAGRGGGGTKVSMHGEV